MSEHGRPWHIRLSYSAWEQSAIKLAITVGSKYADPSMPSPWLIGIPDGSQMFLRSSSPTCCEISTSGDCYRKPCKCTALVRCFDSFVLDLCYVTSYCRNNGSRYSILADAFSFQTLLNRASFFFLSVAFALLDFCSSMLATSAGVCFIPCCVSSFCRLPLSARGNTIVCYINRRRKQALFGWRARVCVHCSAGACRVTCFVCDDIRQICILSRTVIFFNPSCSILSGWWHSDLHSIPVYCSMLVSVLVEVTSLHDRLQICCLSIDLKKLLRCVN